MRFVIDCGLYILYWIFRFALSLRYRIHIKGLDEIKKAKDKGLLFLPNHPAEMDPLILTVFLWPAFRPQPLVVEHFYYQKGLRFFMDLVHVLPLPSMERGNKWKEKQVEKLKEKITSGLDKGENFLIYPSGMLKMTSDEKLGGASLVSDLLHLRPQTDVVLVRTLGLWGSTFSRALTDTSPDFPKMLLKGFFTILKNGILFTPRRDIDIELAFAPPDMPREGEKLELNKWLENWYNKHGPEELKLVSFLFWKKSFPQIESKEKEKRPIDIPQEQKEKVLQFVSKITGTPKDQIQPDQHLSIDLGLDSIDIAEVNVFLEERFDVQDLPPGQIQTVRDIYEALTGYRDEALARPAAEKKTKWPSDSGRKEPQIGEGKTIQEVFLSGCERMGNHTACADAMAGALSYSRLKKAVCVLSLKIRELPGDNIGILLPSSVGAYVTILATLMAGKVPVMLNWTAGFRNLEHAMATCSLQTVLSSYRFLSRVENIDIGKVDDILVLLEELRKKISLKTKLKGLFRSMSSKKNILKSIGRPINPEEPAVIIFTSGTETLPKGVPLTHNNLLFSQRSAFSRVDLNAQDILYGVLPPFHSFGFTVTGILPLLAGVKVCYAPDPTDAHGLANDIAHWKPTLFCCAPSFIQGVLRVARAGQLKSLRLVVSGAEKMPKQLYEVFSKQNITLLEGYGISECSPIVTLEQKGDPQEGVGRPIPGVELCVINPNTNEVLTTGQEGEICIHGPNVFSGYIGVDKNPFIELNGKRWYRSGDRGLIKEDGILVLTGRLKRFVKIGGEMVSLGGIEEDLQKLYHDNNWISKDHEGPFLAVIARGDESEKSQLILFSIVDVEKETLNQSLKEMGHGRLIKITEVKKVDEIPVTGTGKVHYRLLEEKKG